MHYAGSNWSAAWRCAPAGSHATPRAGTRGCRAEHATTTPGAAPTAPRATLPGGGRGLASGLVIGLHLDPAAGRAPQDVLADLVVHEYGDAERHRRDPPCKAEGVHPQALV